VASPRLMRRLIAARTLRRVSPKYCVSSSIANAVVKKIMRIARRILRLDEDFSLPQLVAPEKCNQS